MSIPAKRSRRGPGNCTAHNTLNIADAIMFQFQKAVNRDAESAVHSAPAEQMYESGAGRVVNHIIVTYCRELQNNSKRTLGLHLPLR